jgi:hypothetical protein
MGNNKAGDWSEEALADFERMYALGGADYMTLSEIAHAMGRTYDRFMSRSAASGLAHRMNLHIKYPRSSVGLTGKPNTRSSKPAKPKTNNPFGKKGIGGTRAFRTESKPLPPPAPVNELDASKAVLYCDAPDNACMWPVGERDGQTLVCGCPRHSPSLSRPSVYCVAHQKVSSAGLPAKPKDGDAYNPTYRQTAGRNRFVNPQRNQR